MNPLSLYTISLIYRDLFKGMYTSKFGFIKFENILKYYDYFANRIMGKHSVNDAIYSFLKRFKTF